MVRRNPDESLRALERAASLGDEAARTRLMNELARSGLKHAAENGDKVAAQQVATSYERAGVLPPGGAKTLMSFYAIVADAADPRVSERTRAPWTGGSVRRFSIAHALAISSFWAGFMGWTMQWSEEPLRYQRRDAPRGARGLIGVPIAPDAEPGADGWIDIPTTRPTPARRRFAEAEGFYFTGVLDYARERGFDVGEDPLAWSRAAGLDT